MTLAVGRAADRLRARCTNGLEWAFATTPFGLVVRGDVEGARRRLATMEPHERALVAEFATTLARLALEPAKETNYDRA